MKENQAIWTKIKRHNSDEMYISSKCEIYVTLEFYSRVTKISLSELYKRKEWQRNIGQGYAIIEAETFIEWLKKDNPGLYSYLRSFGERDLYNSITRFYFESLSELFSQEDEGK